MGTHPVTLMTCMLQCLRREFHCFLIIYESAKKLFLMINSHPLVHRSGVTLELHSAGQMTMGNLNGV